MKKKGGGMIKSLADIAELKLAVNLRSGLEFDLEGDTKIIKVQDVDDFYINTKNLDTIQYKSTDEQLLENGDLIVKTRMPKIFAGILENIDDERVIAVAPMIRVRINKDVPVPPHYLLWFFTSDQAQQFFNQHMVGTVFQTISINHLKELPIPILEERKMQEFADIFEKHLKSQKLAYKNIFLRERLVNSTLNNYIGEYNDTNRY